MPDMKKLGLTTAAGGVAEELFAHELQRVLENIRDPNTGAGKRKIVLTFTLTPHEDRSGARNEMKVACQAKSSLQPVDPAESYAFLSVKKGQVSAFTHDVRQGELLEEEEEEDPAVTSIEAKRKENGTA